MKSKPELKPSPEFYNNLGVSLINLKKYDEAEKYLNLCSEKLNDIENADKRKVRILIFKKVY